MLPVIATMYILLWRRCDTFCTSGFVDGVTFFSQWALAAAAACTDAAAAS